MRMATTAHGRRPSLAFVTDIVTPYTIAVMGELAQLTDLLVLFAAETSGRGQNWDLSDLGFRHLVIGGWVHKRAQADLSDYYLSPRLFRELARYSPDAVISAGWSFPTYYAALYARLWRRVLVIHSDGSSHTERELSALQRLSRRVLVPLADGFAPNTVSAADRFRELGATDDQLHLAPHSTNLTPFWNIERSGLEPRTAVRVLGVGRLLPRKGFDRLVDAFALACDEHPELELRLVGTGPERDNLQSRARALGLHRVELAGFVDQPHLAEVYADSDIFVFPSLQEEFGFVLLEAMAAGLACIASPYAGATKDLIRDGENGLVVDPDDRSALSSALLSLAADPDARRRLGERARRDSMKRTPRATAEGYVEAVAAAEARRRAR